MLICHSFFEYIFSSFFLSSVYFFFFWNTLNILLYMPKKIYADTRQTSKWMIWKTQNMFCWILKQWNNRCEYMFDTWLWFHSISKWQHIQLFFLGSIAIKGCWFLEYSGKYLFLLRIMYVITTYGISKMWNKKNEKAWAVVIKIDFKWICV